MGRTYIVEETVGQYLSSINLQGKPFVSGLLIGQCSSQKDYVILATRTPPKEEQNDKVKQPRAKLDNLDEEWATEHASQVSRMLPGGLVVLGIFIITTLELADDFQNALRRSSARPADWKYQSRVSASWLSLDCTVHVNIHIPLSATSVSYTLEKNTKSGLTRWAKQIENGVYLINGQVKGNDCDLLEGQKKSRGNTQATAHSFDVRVLTQLLLNSDHRSTATVQICSGSVNLRGNVKCRAYIHSNRPKVKDAVQAVKRDILNTVADRCEILFEDLLLNEIPEKKNYELPQRVFVPLPGSTVMLCDYKFGDESAEEIRDHFSEMLDHEIQIEDLEIAEEVNTACMTSSVNSEASLTNTSEEQPEQPKKTIGVKIQQNIGVIAALAVAVLAAGISFHYFSD
ncbi:protein odr-4 homolog isoform X1 [Mus musculus]|uniref:protein odr-4 homolog isoform X1 n=2 Tax=Mus musculus TaxID=10090 RepID=UPI001677EA4A|nr:protein odr-4 homolog isoform X1 [Mus musculus]